MSLAAPNRLRQYASLITATGAAPGAPSSSAPMVRPRSADTPSTPKKFADTKRPFGCSSVPSP